MFQRARLKLTAWYVVILMAVCLLFSFAIYTGINSEFNHIERVERNRQEEETRRMPLFERMQKERAQMGLPPVSLRLRRFDPTVIPQARARLLIVLGVINLGILVLAGSVGYFLAGRTLRPIQLMVDEQNRFITDASHELRTPLTALRSEIEVALRNKSLNSNEAKKLLASNLEEVMSLQALSDNLLDLAQSGKTSDHAYFTSVSLLSSIDAAIKKLNGSFKKKQITLLRKVKDTTIMGREDRIIELFVILLDNAIKYSPTKSTITITATIQKDIITVAITDEGRGIDKEDLPHIFDRFYRANKSRSKEKIAGYGLGLSIAQTIIAQHNGTIQVESKENKGSTFIVNLPKHHSIS